MQLYELYNAGKLQEHPGDHNVGVNGPPCVVTEQMEMYANGNARHGGRANENIAANKIETTVKSLI